MSNFRARSKLFLKGLKNLLGVGIYLVLIGMMLEVLTTVALPWLSWPISLSLGLQITLTFLCVTFCLAGMIWFNQTLNLVQIHLAGGENRLMTQGPFNYVRHPLYATLLISLPPLFIIWFADMLFIVPWVLLYLSAYFLTGVEERNLVQIFGDEYHDYQQFVPGLFPYKGRGGLRFREYCESVDINNEHPAA